METGDQHFFELAATIIPIVLFGSVLARFYEPPDLSTPLKARHGIAAILLGLAVTFVCGAELVAIIAAFDTTGVSQWMADVVAIALVGAIFGFGVAILIPWVWRFHREGRIGWLVTIVPIVALVVAFGFSAIKVVQIARDNAQFLGQLSTFEAVVEAKEDTKLAWLKAQIRARADHKVTGLEREELSLLGGRKRKAEQRFEFAEQPY